MQSFYNNMGRIWDIVIYLTLNRIGGGDGYRYRYDALEEKHMLHVHRLLRAVRVVGHGV